MVNRVKKVSIIGSYPPPYGGVSVHIKRLASGLSESKRLGFIYTVGNIDTLMPKNPESFLKILKRIKYGSFIYPFYWLFRYAIFDKSKILHIHNSEYYALIIAICRVFLRKKIVFTVHDQFHLMRLNKDYKLFLPFFIKRLFKERKVGWIAVNETIRDQLIFHGVSEKQIQVIPAHISNIDNYTNIPLEIGLKNFINTHKIIISLYAHEISETEEFTDIYGVSFAIKAFSELLKRYKNIGLVICISGTKNNMTRQKYFLEIDRAGISGDVYFTKTDFDSGYQLWFLSRIYIRPTTTDGDSCSVREALECGCKVIASDVVSRPEGCIIFHSGDLDDFVKKLIDNIDSADKPVSKIINRDSFFDRIIELYDTI